jgi:ankyrin repeat protein
MPTTLSTPELISRHTALQEMLANPEISTDRKQQLVTALGHYPELLQLNKEGASLKELINAACHPSNQSQIITQIWRQISETCLNFIFEAPPEGCPATLAYFALKQKNLDAYNFIKQQFAEAGKSFRDNPFILACRFGFLELAKELWDKAPPETRLADNRHDSNGQTALSLAAGNGHQNVVIFLLDYCHFDSNTRGKDKDKETNVTALHMACGYNQQEIAELLWQRLFGDKTYPELTAPEKQLLQFQEKFPFSHCVTWDKAGDSINFLVAKKIPLSEHSQEEVKQTAFYVCCRKGRTEQARRIWHALPDTEKSKQWTNNGWHPLHVAAENGHFAAVKFLVNECAFSCDLRGQNKWGNIALKFALENAHIDVAEFLWKKMFGERTYLELTPEEKKKLVSKLGYQLTHFLNEKEGDAEAAIHFLQGKCFPLNIRREDSFNESALYYYTSEQNIGALKALLNKLTPEEKQDQYTNNGWHPLLKAADDGSTEIVKLFIESRLYSPFILLRNSYGCNAFSLALEAGHVETAKYLWQQMWLEKVLNGRSWEALSAAEKETALTAASNIKYQDLTEEEKKSLVFKDGKGIAYYACFSDSEEVFEFIARKGIPLNQRTTTHPRMTPFNNACFNKKLQSAKAIYTRLSRRERLNQNTHTGLSPVQSAIKRGCLAVVIFLHKELNVSPVALESISSEKHPIRLAAQARSIAVLKYVWKWLYGEIHGTLSGIQEIYSTAPLRDSLEITKQRITIKTSVGETELAIFFTPLAHYLASRGKNITKEALVFLKNRGIKLNTRLHGITPFMAACCEGNLATAKTIWELLNETEKAQQFTEEKLHVTNLVARACKEEVYAWLTEEAFSENFDLDQAIYPGASANCLISACEDEKRVSWDIVEIIANTSRLDLNGIIKFNKTLLELLAVEDDIDSSTIVYYLKYLSIDKGLPIPKENNFLNLVIKYGELTDLKALLQHASSKAIFPSTGKLVLDGYQTTVTCLLEHYPEKITTPTGEQAQLITKEISYQIISFAINSLKLFILDESFREPIDNRCIKALRDFIQRETQAGRLSPEDIQKVAQDFAETPMKKHIDRQKILKVIYAPLAIEIMHLASSLALSLGLDTFRKALQSHHLKEDQEPRTSLAASFKGTLDQLMSFLDKNEELKKTLIPGTKETLERCQEELTSLQEEKISEVAFDTGMYPHDLHLLKNQLARIRQIVHNLEKELVASNRWTPARPRQRLRNQAKPLTRRKRPASPTAVGGGAGGGAGATATSGNTQTMWQRRKAPKPRPDTNALQTTTPQTSLHQ